MYYFFVSLQRNMAQTRTSGPTIEDIMRDVRSGHVAPIYLLEGEEAYFIDRLSSALCDALVPEEQRDFDMDVQYGLDTDAKHIVESCRQFPLIAEKRVVVLKEMHQMRGSIDALGDYAANPSPSTVLVLCHKGGTLDRRKATAKAIAKAAVVYTSRKLYERELPTFIAQTLKGRGGYDIEPQAVQMLTEYVGTDVARLDNALEKLCYTIPDGQRRITAALVEEQTGLSREYNSFELVSALARRDKSQALKIVKYFNTNPRGFALPATLSTMFAFYSDLMLTYYSPDKSERGVAAWLEQPDWKVRKDIIPAMKVYPARKVLNILHEIRRTDGKSKGVDGCRMSQGDLLLELVLYILG